MFLNKNTLSKILWPTIWMAALFLLWESAVFIFDVQDYILPSPSDFFPRIFIDFDRLSHHTAATSWLILVGFLAGAVPGIPLGYLIATVKFFERTLFPLIIFIRSIPKIALAPLLIIWFGFSAFPKILLAGLLIFFPVLIDSISGFKSVDERLYHITRSMGANRWQTFRYVRLPSAMPHIFSGLKIAIVLSVTVVVVVEYLNSDTGLGYVVVRAMTNQDLSLMFAALTIAAVMGLIFNYILQFSEYFLMPWLKYKDEEE